MIIVPGLPPLQQTRHSRELGRKIEQLVRDYQREHPDVKESDVRAAVSQLATGESPETTRRKRILGAVMATLLAGAFAAMAASGGGRFENNTTVWRIIGAVVAVVALGLAAVRMARKD